MLALTAQLAHASASADRAGLHHDAAVHGGGPRARSGVLLFLDEIETVGLAQEGDSREASMHI